MIGFVAARIASAVLVIFGVAVLVFMLIHFIPGDPVEVMLGESARPADREALRAALGLDRPLPVQFFDYLKGLAQLDLGTSLHSKRPVLDLIAERLPATAQLASRTVTVTTDSCVRPSMAVAIATIRFSPMSSGRLPMNVPPARRAGTGSDPLTLSVTVSTPVVRRFRKASGSIAGSDT